MNDFISVIMPVFNCEKYLSLSVESILRQTCSDFEFIIINDGSQDNSAEILEDYRCRDTRIRLIHQENKGIVYSLNRGISIAQGDLIARMDGDDVADASRLEIQKHFFEFEPAVIAAGTDIILIDEDGDTICTEIKLTDHNKIVKKLLRGHGGAICHPSLMCRKVAVDMVKGYREKIKWAEDLDLYLRLAETGRITNINNPLLHYRVKRIDNPRRDIAIQSGVISISEAFIRKGIVKKNLCLDYSRKPKSNYAWYLGLSVLSFSSGNIEVALKYLNLLYKNNSVIYKFMLFIFGIVLREKTKTLLVFYRFLKRICATKYQVPLKRNEEKLTKAI